jgi:hypothetical protein
VDWADLHRWKMINEALHLEQPEPLETYSTSEHLYTALHIPAGAKGVLPRAQRERAGLEAEQLEDIGETGKTRSRGGSSPQDRDRRPDSGGAARRDHDAHGADGAERQRSQRGPRRRTRGGQPADGALVAVEPGTATAAAGGQAGTAADHAADVAAGQPARKARRRRSSRGRGGQSAVAGQPAAASGPAGDPADSNS